MNLRVYNFEDDTCGVYYYYISYVQFSKSFLL